MACHVMFPPSSNKETIVRKVICFCWLVCFLGSGCTGGTTGTPGKVTVTSTADLGKVAGGKGEGHKDK